MKYIFKIVMPLLLAYAILMLSIDGLYSLLSLYPESNLSILIEERIIPYIICIACNIYGIIRIWNHRNKE